MTTKQFVDKYLVYAKQTQSKYGLTPTFILSQAALESGWGESAPGNMFFGIKAKGPGPNSQLLTTTEYSKRSDLKFPQIISVTETLLNGKNYFKYIVKDYFKKYNSPADSFSDHAGLFFRNERYSKALNVKDDTYAFINEISKAGYASDPSYASKLFSIANEIDAILQERGEKIKPTNVAQPFERQENRTVGAKSNTVLLNSPYASNRPAPTETLNEGIYRIEQLFSHKIELDELSLPANTPDKSTGTPKIEDVASIEYPLIKINDYIFSRNEIQSMEIDCTGFLPKITLKVGLISQVFIAKNMPKDGDIISIAIRNKNDVLKIIRNDYVITSVYASEMFTASVKSPSFITFYGELFIPGLRSAKDDHSFEGTSMEAMIDFASILNLGFATNEYNTDDKQIWLKANTTGDEYIQQLTERSYKDEKSFFMSWIDVYYNLNFINVNLQLLSSEKQLDVAVVIDNIDKNTFFSTGTNENDKPNTVKMLSNFQNFKTTSFFIEYWKPANKSSSITFDYGTKIHCELFEHNQNLYEDDREKYWAIPIEPIYDENKSSRAILLRGRATQQYTENTKELKRANHPYVGVYEKFPWLGIQYTISNTDENSYLWDGNHHRNYHVAKIQNIINIKELEKLNLIVTVKGNNFNIIRGDKLPIALVRSDNVDNSVIHEEVVTTDKLDLFYSGWYIVKGFNLLWSSAIDDSVASTFSHEYILTRREWPLPIAVDYAEEKNKNI